MINGKVALVMNAGQGIGGGIASRLAKDGGDIAIVDLNEDKMVAVAEEVIVLGRRATTFKADVRSRRDAGGCGRVRLILAGSDSDYMTGQAPLIDGGMVYR